MHKWKIGIIGCGTIGSGLARVIVAKFRKQAVLKFLCDQDTEKAKTLQRKLPGAVAVVPVSTVVEQSDLVIEAANPRLAAQIMPKVLRRDKHALMMSVGGLLAHPELDRVLKKTRGKLWIPSGALAGVDALLAAVEGGVERVTLITKKPIGGLKKAPFFKKRKLPNMKKPVRLFAGTASQAVRLFPQNVNVAAVLSLAGIGPKRTRVEIWAIPDQKYNEHEVIIEGAFGRVHTVSRCLPSPGNPRTSYLAVLSAIATLNKIFSSVHIGT